MVVRDIIEKFDEFLHSRGKKFEAVVIGGAALNLLDIITRETKDCDVLEPKIPEDIKKLSIEFSGILRSKGIILFDNWFNNGPDSLKNDLPKSWQKNIVKIYSGKSLILHTVSREDLLKTKLFALCDRGIDEKDCIFLKPTRDELINAMIWVNERDGNSLWPKHVKNTFERLANKLGYEL